MDEDGFREYLKKQGKSERATDSIIQLTSEFEQYLSEEGTAPAAAQPEDLEGLALWIEENQRRNPNKHLWAITAFYQFMKNEKLAKSASALRGKKIKRSPFRINKFRGISQDYARELSRIGIDNVDQMIQRGKTPELRMKLVEATGIPMKAIIEFVKLSDLSRLGAVKSIRARLYHDSGIDTLDKLERFTPRELREFLLEWIEKTGFDGIAPQPKEAENVIKTASKLPRIVEYD
ncbi:MAG: DUF4332 domain-containing protein [Promethearchaeota archaeon]